MLKAVSGICLSMMVIAGCSSGQAAEKAAPPSPTTPTPEPNLRAALLQAPKGMKIAYGPETGAFGSLKSTQQGLQAIRQSSLDHPECAGAAQLDATQPAIAKSPAAVVAFSSARGTITQALVSLPTTTFPGALPSQCHRYQATVQGAKVTYTTKELAMPQVGDQSRAFITTATGGKNNAQIGSVIIRRANVVMSLLVVGRRVKQSGLFQLGHQADAALARHVH
ncbi:hypothetical protein [Nonomuraea sediminis]|uniref:hypothetical protein n=1 Tax=Nonomuraea sediminis TaxID=2835864 RepID=UPI001BDC4538|nr:hypothetical protein [Nonomuraea sediminis]